ncbi:MAG TPA: hypothetical protein VLD39_02670 [Gammaproteobacteria bacterium]|nr:hypothetical protein [Gammaproteobacteria bacterium]
MTKRTIYAGLLASIMLAPAWAQGDSAGADAAVAEAAAETADAAASAADEIDREPVDCIVASRIRQTKIIDNRTIVFYMTGGRAYVNELAINCPRLAREKRFSYDLRTSQLCSTDYITVLEYWGSTLREGPSCGLGQFHPITAEEAELLGAEPDEMLERAGAVEETVESAGEAVPAESEQAPPSD